MSFFIHKTTQHDPVADALISITSDDSRVYLPQNVLKNSAVYTAVNIIASDIAGNPVTCGVPIIDKMINQQPNDVMSGYNLKYALAVSMLLTGNAYAEIDGHNLYYLPNNEMSVEYDVADADYMNEVRYSYTPTGQKSRIIAPTNILHFKYMANDGICGISPLSALDDELKIQAAANKLLVDFFTSGIRGTTVVKAKQSELNDKAIKAIRQKFDSANMGGYGSQKTIVVDDSMDISNLPMNLDSLKLFNSNDYTIRAVACAFGLPVEKLGLENQHSNQEQSNLQYLQGTLQRYFDAFTNELEYKLGHEFTFDTSKLLSLNPQTQQEQAINGYTNGLLTKNEARNMVGLPPVSEGDRFINDKNNQLRSDS